jgi:Zn-finger nucleic acid-binding protein
MPVKPSSPEEEYFQKENLRKVKQLREQAAREVKEADRQRLKELHWMHCPKCGMKLAELNFRGVEVDSCVACGGMYLDKGEIEKAMAFKEPGWLGRAVMAFVGAEKDLDSTKS